MTPRILLALLSSAVVDASAQLSRPTISTLPSGTVRVVNDGPSRWQGTEGWRLDLERTITPAEGSPGMLARPIELAVNSDGWIVVSDVKASGLLLFHPDGRFARVVGGLGSGPGEFQPGVSIDFLGDTIAAVDDHRAIVWKSDGKLIGQWVTNGSSQPPKLDGAGHLLVPVVLPAAWPGRPAMIRYTFAGAAIDTIVLPPPTPLLAWRAGGAAVAIPFRPPRVGAFDSRLRYFHAFPTSYRIAVAAQGRDTVRIISLAGMRAQIPGRLRDSLFERVSSTPLLRRVAKREDIPTEHPFFYSFQIDDHDNIWIARPGPDGATVHYDVVDPTGSFLGSVIAPPGRARSQVWRNDRMYQLAEDDNGIPSIQVYRVVRGRYLSR